MSLSSRSVPTLTLPTDFALDLAIGNVRDSSSQHAFYSISQTSQAFRQAVSICTVLAYPLISTDTVFAAHSTASEDLMSLLDVWLDLIQIHKRWDSDSIGNPQTLIANTLLSLIQQHSSLLDTNPILVQKAGVLLVLCCSDLAVRPSSLLDQTGEGRETRAVYCRSLLFLASAVIHSETTKRFVASQLVPDLTRLMRKNAQPVDGHDGMNMQSYAVIGDATDFSVSPGILAR